MAPAVRAGALRRRAIAGRASAAAVSLGAEAVADYWHPALDAALAAVDVVIPAVVGLILLTTIPRQH